MSITLLQPFNIDSTANYTFNKVTVSSNVDLSGASNVNLGAVSNIRISGGTANYVLQTDGAGNLSWVAQSGGGNISSISNGNSNVSIPASNGNVNISSAGNANVLVVTGTGINVTGTLNATDNIQGGNLVSANYLTGTLTTAAQPNITSVGLLTSLSVGPNSSITLTGTSGFVRANSIQGTDGVAALYPAYGGVTGAVGITSNLTVGTGAAGNITANGNVTASYFIGNGSSLSSITGSNVTGQVANALVAGTVYTNAQPNITSLGTLTDVNVSGNAIIGGNLTVSGTTTYINVTNLAVSDPVIQLQTGPNGVAPTSNSGKDVGTALNYYDTAARVGFMGWDVSNAEIALASNVTLTNEVATFNQYANVRAGYFIGNGSQLTGITSAAFANYISNGTSNVNILTANGNVTVGVAGVANIAGFTAVGLSVGAGSLSRAPNVGANSALYVVGNISSDAPPITIQNRFATGYSSMDIFNSSNIFMGAVGAANPSATSVPALANLAYLYGASGASGVGIYATTGNVTISAASNANIVTVTGTGVNVSGTLNSTGNLTAANANLGNLISANYATIGGPITGQTYQLVVKSNGVNGVFALQSNVGGYAEASFFNASNTQAGGVGYAGSSATYYPNQAYMWSSNGIAFSGNGYSASGGTKNMFIDGSGIVNIPTGVTSTSTTTGAFVVTGGIGVSGNIYSGGILSVTGNANVGNIGATNGVFTNVGGNGSALTSLTGGNVTGQVANALVAGTVYTAAQPNITSVGLLTSLSVGPNSSITLTGTSGYVKANSIQGTDGVSAIYPAYSGVTGAVGITGNLTVGIGIAANITANGNVTASYFIGNGSSLTSIAGANVTGTVANATYATSAGSATTAGTVTTAAQPNITSLGTLSNLTSNGTVNFTNASNVSLGPVGNVKITGGTANYVLSTDGTGNLSWVAQTGGGGGGTPGGSNTQIQFNDSGTFAGSASLTFDKTTNTLTANNFVATTTANLGDAGNVKIVGGAANYFLKTDGTGNLTWASMPSTAITVDTFTSNGVQTTYTLTTTPSSINQTMVNIDGVFQLREAYSLTGADITFDSAPANGSIIEVTTTQGVATGAGSFVVRNYTGNGVQTNFTVTNGVTATSLLVAENGILQVPTTDYTVSGSTLTFTNAPANGMAIQIRELGVVVASTPSGTSSARALGYSLVFGL